MPAYIPPFAGIYFEYFELNRPEPQWLPQISLSSATKLHHTASRTLLTQKFINPSIISPIPSAKYTFPLYESCAIVAFRCYIGRRLIEGIIKEKDDATATYHAAIRRNEPASLLEQQTADVFSTSIGNIPAGETVTVEIEYIMELKHDAEVDGLRFTIPTSIAPRYGAPPSELVAGYRSSAVTASNMNISVEISMSSSIKSVQSPSHPISLHLGGHTTDTPDDAFNPQHALATLGQTTTELGKDFILLIKCASLSSPTALLEVHPTIPNSRALMVTLVPKFNLPKSAKPEVVFIVDRSGSMSSRVAPLKSSLSVFLKSLPLDVNFNICSFGTRHSFLWTKSRPYSNQSFAEAQTHCDSMKADFGGTEILPAIKSTIERRLNDLNLEIMVLTDGQVWNSEILFEYVEKETKKGDVRLFSLGIGRDVSHALIDGLARVGRGFSQVVSDEREGMESKVARMLRGALSAHVVDYRLEWEGKPNTEVFNSSLLSSRITRPSRRINLFDSHADTDLPVSFSDPPDFDIPSVIQAPYKIQPLFPFSRSTAYAILSSDAHSPTHVWLRGTTPEGDELELEIPVQKVPGQGETIHQLAARKILQELKDGTGYVHGAVDKEDQPGLLAEWVKKEGVRVGLKYGVASHWTSFVAVERKEQEVVEEGEGEKEEGREQRQGPSGPGDDNENDDDSDWDTVVETERDVDAGEIHGRSVDRSSAAPYRSRVAGSPSGGLSVPVMMMTAPPPPPIPYPTSTKYSSLSSKLSDTREKGKMSATGKSDSEESLLSLGLGSSHSELSMDWSAESVPAGRSAGKISDGFWNFRGRGKAPEGESDKKQASRSIWSSTQKQMKPSSSTSFFASSSVSSLQSVSRLQESSSAGSTFSGADPADMSGTFGSLLSSNMTIASAPAPDPVFESRQQQSSFGYKPAAALKFFGSSPLKNFKKTSDSIGISYSPSIAPPKERLAADTGAQPLSSRTKRLIELQTFDGCFMLDSALASLLGVSITVLEARLVRFVPDDAGLSLELRKKVWATVLAIKLFEAQLGGERGVWQLVVDKARAWFGGLVAVGVEDVSRLEKMAGEVLGV